MFEQPDWKYQAEPLPAEPPPPRRRAPIRFVLAFVVAAIAGVAWFLMRSPAPEVPAQEQPATPPQQQQAEVVENRYDLPPLDDSDAFMRERVNELTSHPLAGAWLKTRGLARNLAVVIENTAGGLTPSAHLPALRPSGPFRVLERGERLYIDPTNYERFNRIADAAQSIGPAAAAAMYRGLRPLLQTAYDELGHQEPIDRAVQRAIDALLRAPTVQSGVELTIGAEGVGYRYADPRLEAMTGAQKQLMRMGPRNQQIIQERLRRFSEAAGLRTG